VLQRPGRGIPVLCGDQEKSGRRSLQAAGLPYGRALDYLDLAEGAWGQDLLQPGKRLLEIKIPNAMPLCLADTLSELGIFPASFSKYGAAYQTWLRQHLTELRVKRYA
jgi:hypothetical protein